MSNVLVKTEFQSMRAEAIIGLEETTVASSMASQSSSSRRSFLAGSDVSKNSLLYLADNGQLLKVENSTTANYKPVFAVAFESITANNYVNIYNEGETIIIPNASFEIGKKIYLSADGLPTTEYAYLAGNLYQRLGIAISVNSFVLNIESAKKMT